MNSLICPFSRLLPLSLSTHLQLKPDYFRLGNNKLSSLSSSFNPDSSFSLRTRWASIGATPPSDEGPVSVINFEDFIEKDWSFLDLDEFDSKERAQKLDRIISAGEINKSSRAMIVTSSECFVDQVVESSPCDLLLIVHDSLFMLAGIKEKYDKVKCWQGELIYVPEKWVPFDVVFLYFLPALPFSLDQIFEALANRCLPGNASVGGVHMLFICDHTF